MKAEASAASSLTLTAYGIEEVSSVQSYKKLGQAQLSSGSQDTIYTVPPGTVTICNVIVVTNVSSATRTLQVWHVPNGGSVGNSNILINNLSLSANAVMVWNKGEITVISGTTGTIKYIPFYVEGIVVDEETIFDGFFFENNSTILKITLMVKEIVTGSNLTIDLLKDGAEQTKIATLSDGSVYETTDIADTAYLTTERFGLKVKSVGSTTPGKGLTVLVHWRET